MIKFRCLRCGQKIAVNEEGVGVVISCPTCTEGIVVPPHTDAEFLPRLAGTVELMPVESPEDLPVQMKAALLPHLARALMTRVFQAVLLQRRQLLDTQDTATAQVAELEQRIVLLHAKLQRRLVYYQDRIRVLEAELAAKHAENRELMQRHRHSGNGDSVPPSVTTTSRVNLREAGFLLRT